MFYYIVFVNEKEIKVKIYSSEHNDGILFCTLEYAKR